MRNWSWLNEHFSLTDPLEYMRLNQVFGACEGTTCSFYKELGLLGHNGLDLRASLDTPCRACFSGKVTYAGEDGSGGRSVRLWSEPKTVRGIDYRLEAIYYHLNSWVVKTGDDVSWGEHIGNSGNTGKYTTGPHLHFEIKPLWFENGQWQKDYQNGFRGAIDPLPLMRPNWDSLPVDKRYGREKSWLAEFNMRFRNRWLHQQFYKTLKRHPLSITERELFGLVYGGWDFETVFLQPAMAVHWMVQKKQDYLDKVPRPKPFDKNVWKL